MKYIILGVLAILAAACSEESTNDSPLNKDINLAIIQDQTAYDQTVGNIISDTNSTSDPFELHYAWLDGWELKTIVSYSGGCEEHDFYMIWPEVITMIYPPDFDVYLLHDANNDLCEAYLTDTLTFNLEDNQLGINQETLQIMELGIINESNPKEIVYPND